MGNFKFILLLILTSFFCKANSYSQTGEWVLGKGIDGSVEGYISCADSMNAMVATYGRGAHQQIRKTEDGGKSWKIVYADSGQLGNGLPRRVKSVSYPTPNFAIAQYDSFYVVRTTDGGKTWSRIKFADLKPKFSVTGWHGRISMFDEKYGYLSTSNTGPDRLFGTEDGGLTWTEVNRFQGEFLNSLIENLVCLGKDKLVCALGPLKVARSAIAVTSDGGKNWKITSEGVFNGYVEITNFSFVDSLNGFVTGYKRDSVTGINYPLLYRTRDGGYSWEEVKREVKMLFKDGGAASIAFLDTLNGVMAATGDIMRTTDGGKTWESEFKNGKKCIVDSWDVYRGKGNKGMALSFHGFTMQYEVTTKSVGSVSEVMSGLSISPNPASTELSVRFGVGVSNIRLSSVLGGQLPVTSTEQNGVTNYDISNLSSGLYFVTWKEKGINKSKKFVVQR